MGVKCLHAHYAWFLAGGADPVGRWTHTTLVASAARSGTRSVTPEREGTGEMGGMGEAGA